MIRIRKENVVLQVPEEKVQEFLNNGYYYADAPEQKKEKVSIAPKVKDALEDEEAAEEEKEIAPKVKGKK